MHCSFQFKQVLKLKILFILIISQGAWAQLDIHISLKDKLKEIQQYSAKADNKNFSREFPNGILEFKEGHTLEISDKENFKILNYSSSPLDKSEIKISKSDLLITNSLIDFQNERVIYWHDQNISILDLKNKNSTQCDVGSSSPVEMIKVGENYYFYTNIEDGNKEIKTSLKKLVIQKRQCEITPFSEITHSKAWGFKIFDNNGRVSALFEKSKWGMNTDSGTAKIVTFSDDGHKMPEKNLQNFKLSGVDYKSPTANKKGIILLLIDKDDPEGRTNAYLVKDDLKPQLLIKNVISAEWVNDNEIIANKGSHSGSSEIYILNGKDQYKPKKIDSPVGLKSEIKYKDGQISFNNLTHDKVKRKYQTDAIKNKTREIPQADNQLALTMAEIPNIKEISYTSGDHKVASYLSTPKAGCDESDKKPVIVYLHGGAYDSSANSPGGMDEKDYLLFSQLGWPVIEAGYYGDEYYGEEFRIGADRWIDRDRYTKTLQDIQTAGEYAKTLPCADPKKIILLGHSHGRVIANLYATDKNYNKISPYAGIILRNGLADDKDITDFIGGNKPQLAVLGGDGNKSTNLDVENDGLTPICHPKTDIIGVEAALKILKDANAISEKYYGVPYKFTQETLNEILPMNRSKNINDKPILIVSTSDGSDDGTPGSAVRGSKNLEKELKKYSSKIEAWYPNEIYNGKYETNGHMLSGEIEIEFILKVKKWAENI